MKSIPFNKKFLHYTGLYFIAGILVFSGSTKIINPEPLTAALELLNILPAAMTIFISVLLPVTEIMLGIFLLIKMKVKVTLTFTGALFFTFLIFAIYGTITGINTDCGCFGEIVRSDIGWGMILRNTILFVIVILLYFTSAAANVQAE